LGNYFEPEGVVYFENLRRKHLTWTNNVMVLIGNRKLGVAPFDIY
jgi:hypothetical protein